MRAYVTTTFTLGGGDIWGGTWGTHDKNKKKRCLQQVPIRGSERLVSVWVAPHGAKVSGGGLCNLWSSEDLGSFLRGVMT